MEKLSGCFSTWQHAQQSLIGTARLMRIDLEIVHINSQSVTDLLAEFTGHLKKIKSALEARDFATLNKLLMNGISHTTALWHEAIQSLRGMIEPI